MPNNFVVQITNCWRLLAISNWVAMGPIYPSKFQATRPSVGAGGPHRDSPNFLHKKLLEIRIPNRVTISFVMRLHCYWSSTLLNSLIHTN